MIIDFVIKVIAIVKKKKINENENNEIIETIHKRV